MAVGDISGPGVRLGAVSGAHMPGVGLGIWVGGALGGAATPNDLLIGGTRACVGWWISNNGALPYGSVTLDEASVDDDLTTWAQTNVTISGSQSDPFGGSSAYRINVPNDSTPLARQITGTPSAKVTTYTDYALYVKNDSGPDCIRGVNPQAVVNARWCVRMSDGAHQEDASVTVTVTDIGSGWLRINVANRVVGGITDTWSLSFQDQYSVGIGNYTGDGAGVFVYGVSLTQPRVSVIADESLTALGAARNAHLMQGTDANQPGFGTPFDLINGLPVAQQEPGRKAYLSTTHADPVGVASGANPHFALTAICELSAGSFGGLLQWNGAGAELDIPLYRNGAELYSIVGSDFQQYGSGLASLLDTPCAVAVFGHGTRQRSLYISGVHRATITHGVVGAQTMTVVNFMRPATDRAAKLAELAVFSDLSSLGSHAAIYAALQGILQGKAARWGGLPA